MLNHIKIVGHVTDGPHIYGSRTSRSIVARCKVAVAVPGRQNRQYLPVVAFGNNAEVINNRVTDDTKVEIIGHLEHTEKYGLQIVAGYVAVLDGGLAIAR